MSSLSSSISTWFNPGSRGGLVAAATTIGAVAAGAALIEAALIPGLAIGAVAVLAPRMVSAVGARVSGRPRRPARTPSRPLAGAMTVSPKTPVGAAVRRFKPGRALAKTVTFRIVVTTLDFTTNYVVLGSLTTAAGLSAFALVSGPIFYFLHESAWDYRGAGGRMAESSEVKLLGYRMSPALAKTITYRIVATTAEFTATYVVVQDLATAALLSSFGVVLGPFVYYGHERAWEIFRGAEIARPAPARLALPAAAG